jgi:hypothetical protein
MPLLHLGLYAHMVACADPFHRGRLRYHRSAALRELSNQLSLLNHHISAHVDLNDTDLDCLELINRHGPVNPSALARRSGRTPPPSPASWTGSNAAAGSPASTTPPTAAPSSSAHCATATPSCSASTGG